MSTCTSFKCRACGGTGLGPVRWLAGGKVERPPLDCIYCGGEGQIHREVADTEDRMLHMARVARSYWSGTCRTALPDHLAARFKVRPSQGKPKQTYKINHIVTEPGRTAPRITIKTKIKPFNAKKHRASRHYVSKFEC